MAFKMKRPFKMKGPSKSVLKFGKNTPVDDSGLYYNSSMGPMKMHSPSALKQMEEDMGGMEEMMGMMGEMGGEAPAGPVEEAPVEKESEEGKPETFEFNETDLEGGDMGEVKKDEATGQLYVIVENEDRLIDGSDGNLGEDIKVIIPQNIAEQANAKVGSLLTGGNYEVKLNAETNEYEIATMDGESQGEGEETPESPGLDTPQE